MGGCVRRPLSDPRWQAERAGQGGYRLQRRLPGPRNVAGHATRVGDPAQERDHHRRQRRHPVRGGDHAGHDRGGSAEPADGPGAVARAQAAVQPGLARGLCRDPALQPVHGC
ncbi:hypothetical protein G6F59_018281 [Rhizopus arrhizus]|nr:hypothetical protein G6F59_018281 [Rhizopus arrhizus]